MYLPIAVYLSALIDALAKFSSWLSALWVMSGIRDL